MRIATGPRNQTISFRVSAEEAALIKEAREKLRSSNRYVIMALIRRFLGLDIGIEFEYERNEKEDS